MSSKQKNTGVKEKHVDSSKINITYHITTI